MALSHPPAAIILTQHGRFYQREKNSDVVGNKRSNGILFCDNVKLFVVHCYPKRVLYVNLNNIFL